VTWPLPLFRLALLIAAASVLAAGAAPVAAQVYKCTDVAGKTTYADSPCARNDKPLAIANPSAVPGTGNTACSELLDELNRLAAISERNRMPPTQRAKALTKQYEARCVGISRAGPPPAR
jgi:hypothetical protein